MVVLAVAAIVVLLAGVHVDDSESEGLGLVTLASLGVAFVFTLGILGQNGVAFAGAISIDSFAAFFELAILIAAMFTVMMSLDYASENRISGAEYYSLLLFSTLGMMLMATAGDLIVIFLGLETMSIPVYVLAGIMRRNAKSNEAAIKYFLLGAFSTGFLLYGIALVYGATGTIKLGPIHDAVASGSMASNPLLLLGIGLMVIGFGFKVAAVPFHMWTPDVYEGAPTPVTAFMAVGVKLAAFAAFVRVFLVELRARRRGLADGPVGGRSADYDRRKSDRRRPDQHQADACVLGDRARGLSVARAWRRECRIRPCDSLLPARLCIHEPRRIRSSDCARTARRTQAIRSATFAASRQRQPLLAGAMAIFCCR